MSKTRKRLKKLKRQLAFVADQVDALQNTLYSTIVMERKPHNHPTFSSAELNVIREKDEMFIKAILKSIDTIVEHKFAEHLVQGHNHEPPPAKRQKNLVTS